MQQQMKFISLCLVLFVFTQHVNALESTVRGRARRGERRGSDAALKMDISENAPLTFTQFHDESGEEGIFDASCIGYKLFGCESKVSGPKLLYAPEDMKFNMTTDTCYKFCSKQAGTWGFGLQGGSTCFCTPFKHQYAIFDDSESYFAGCSKACTGNASESCGGASKALFYKLDNCADNPLVCDTNMPDQTDNAQPFQSELYDGKIQYCENLQYDFGDTVDNIGCNVECLPGYILTQNSIRCEQTDIEGMNKTIGLWQGTAQCVPINCGDPECVPYAASETGVSIDFPGYAVYRCKLGYTTDGRLDGNTTFKRHCTEYGVFSKGLGCKPVECGYAPMLPYEDLLTPNRVFTFSESALYQCKEGYTLDGSATGGTHYEKKCLAGGQFTTDKSCEPILCGLVREYANATYMGHGKAVVPPLFKIGTPVQYVPECDDITVADLKGTELKLSQVSTKYGTVVFSYTLTIGTKIEQSTPDTGDYLLGTHAEPFGKMTESFTNGDSRGCPDNKKRSAFVTYSFGPTTKLTKAVETETCVYEYNVDIEQNKCKEIAKAVAKTVPSGETNSAGEFVPYPEDMIPISGPLVKEAEGTLSVFFPMDLKYHCNTGFSLNHLPVEENKVSLNDVFTSSCTADGTMSLKATPCKRVSCGYPKSVDNAGFFPETFVHFTDTVIYSCDLGYTTNSKADGPTEFTVTCGGDGRFVEVIKKCLPVQCGKMPEIANAVVKTPCNDTSMCVFDEEPSYTCKPGYSTIDTDDPWNRTQYHFSGKCLETGLFEEFPKCVNIDNCLVPFAKSGGPFGDCVDHPVPTGDPETDYSIVCHSGYEITKKTREWKGKTLKDDNCTNIDDCPLKSSYAFECGGTNDEGIVAGACIDEVNGYRCDCGEGYIEVNLKGSRNTTCIPMGCGSPPRVEKSKVVYNGKMTVSVVSNTNTTVKLGDMVMYDLPVVYTCEEGYTVTGYPGGIANFNVSCVLKNGSVTQTEAKTCKPVTCGPPYDVAHSEVAGWKEEAIHTSDGKVFYASRQVMEDVDELFYPQGMTHYCDSGYTNDTAGAFVQHAGVYEECKADGSKTPEKKCLPVKCGKPPPVKYATVPDDDVYYPDSAEYTCEQGYSLDGTVAPGMASQKVHCQADSLFGPTLMCQPVICGPAPGIPYASTDWGKAISPQVLTGNFHIGSVKVKIDPADHCAEECRILGNMNLDPSSGSDQILSCSQACMIRSQGISKQECRGYCNRNGQSGCSIKVKDLTFRMCSARQQFSSGALNKLVTNQACMEGCDIEATTQKVELPVPQLHIQKGKECSDLTLEDFIGGKLSVYQESTAHGNGIMYRYNIEVGGEVVQILESGEKIVVGKHESYTSESEKFLNGDSKYCPGGKARSAKVTFDFGDDNLKAPRLVKANEPKICYYEYWIEIPKSVCLEKVYAKFQKLGGGIMVYPNKATYTVHTGYSIDGTCSAKKNFEVECLATSKFTALDDLLPLQPVSCGAPPPVLNAGYGKQEKVYLGVVVYQCLLGYSTDGEPAGADNSGFSIICQENCKYSAPEECKPVVCKPWPMILNALAVKALPKAAFIQRRFLSSDKSVPPPIERKLLLGTCSQSTESYGGKCSRALDGNAATNWGSGSCTHTKSETGSNKAWWKVDLKKKVAVTKVSVTNRGDCCAERLNGFNVYVDDSLCANDVKIGRGETKMIECKEQGESLKIELDPSNKPGRRTLTLCEVQVFAKDIQAGYEPRTVVPGPAKYEEITFEEAVEYECMPGFSLTGLFPDKSKFQAVCGATGNFLWGSTCLNVNDCLDNKCTIHGKCVDHAVPKGVHIDDYHCECASGFKEVIKGEGGKAYRTCENIDDCPEGACAPGVCMDLINNYACLCPKGYYNDTKAPEHLKKKVDPLLIAYHDRGGCGPYGDDYNWDWCDRRSFNCKKEVPTPRCASGKAKLVKTQGTGACCESVQIGGCNYAYFAQYECIEGVAPKEAEWVTIYSKGSFGTTKFGEETFDDMFHSAYKGIAKRECTDCKDTHKEIYFRRKKNPETYSAYKDLIDTWRDADFHKSFDIYSKYEDAVADKNAWVFCNGNDPTIGFPRDCGPKGYEAWQWTSERHSGGSRKNFRWSVKAQANGLAQLNDELIAYWDSGNKGPLGDDYNWAWCNYRSFQCKPIVYTAKCASNKAKLVWTKGTGRCCSSVKYKGVDYAYFAQYECVEIEGILPLVTPKSAADDGLVAYWDRGGCGPHGDDYQWDWCDRRGFRCKPEVQTDKCKSGKAKLVSTQGDGTCCSSVKIDGCDYAYFAQYQCSEDVPKAGCYKQSCGDAPSQAHTEVISKEYKFQDTVTYTCVDGYTLDASPKTSSNSVFKATCNEGPTNGHSGTFSRPLDKCKPVVCGIPPEQPNTVGEDTTARISPRGEECSGLTLEDFVNETLTVTQQSTRYGGNNMYTYDITIGKEIVQHTAGNHVGTYVVGNHKQFGDMTETFDNGDSAHCSGKKRSAKIKFTFGEVLNLTKAAEPELCYYEYEVEIPKSKCQEVAYKKEQHLNLLQKRNNRSSKLVPVNKVVFPEIVHFTCATGYSIDRTCKGNTEYALKCTASGKFEYVGRKKVTCATVYVGEPKIDFANYDGSKMYFPDTRKVTCKTGYSLDGFNAKNNAFTLKTKANCEWVDHDDCEIMNCGQAPDMDYSTKSTKEIIKYEQKVTYKTVTGYTFNGKASGPTSCMVSCLSSGQFSPCTPTGPPKPVECPNLERVKYAMLLDQAPMTFQEVARYECMYGYSTNGKPAMFGDAHKSFSRVCQANGTFSSALSCLPVVCGVAPDLPHAHQIPFTKTSGKGYSIYGQRVRTKVRPRRMKLLEVHDGMNGSIDTEATGNIVYRESVFYECDAGYSLDGSLYGKRRLRVFCKPDGTFQMPVEQCLNIDDCEGNMCSPNGKCEDNPVPTGNHSADYKCICNSGFELKWIEKLGQKFQTCQNIPDCPVGACAPGQCQDLVNDYQCICPAGYHTCEQEPLARELIPGQECIGLKVSDFKGEKFSITQTSTLYGDVKFTYNIVVGTSIQQKTPDTGDYMLGYHVEPFGEMEEYFNGGDSKGCPGGAKRSAKITYTFGPTTKLLDAREPSTCYYEYQVQLAQKTCEKVALGLLQFSHNQSVADVAIGGGLTEKVYHADRICSMPNFESLTPMMERVVPNVNYGVTGGLWAGLSKSDHFAVVWTGFIEIDNPGTYEFSIRSDDGSKLWINDKDVVNNDGLHAMRTKSATIDLTAGRHKVKMTMFECGGGAGMIFKYKGADTNNRWKVTPKCKLSPEGSDRGVITHDCCPDSCGVPPERTHSSPEEAVEIFFPEKMDYVCHRGYTLDGDPDGEVVYESSCQTTAGNTSLSFLGECNAVECAAPNDTAWATKDVSKLSYPEKVTYTCMTGYTLEAKCQGTASFVMSCNETGAIVNKDGGLDLPECRAVSAGKPTKEQLPNAVFAEVEMFFKQTQAVQCSPGYSTDAANKSAKLFTITATSDCKFAIPFSCVPLSCGAAPTYNNSKVSDTAQDIVYPTKVVYTADPGYSIDGTPQGAKTFSTTCNDNGEFDSVDEYVPLKPVSCGNPPEVDNAERPDAPKTYMQVVKYVCDLGFSTDESPVSSDKSNGEFTVTCQASGEYSATKQCKKVTCDSIPAAKKAAKETDGSSFKFRDTVSFKCNPGYSIDGLLGGDMDYDIECLADGKWSEHDNCTNMDDCMEADCKFGKCVDNEEPIGKHIDDYHCDCIKPGYKEEMVHVGGKKLRQCVDIDDCTEEAKKKCDPGACIDEVADYECSCPLGYFRGEGNHTCEKQSCGSPPVVKHSATVEKGAPALLFGDTLEYTCDTGYSWSGAPRKTLTFTVECTGAVGAPDENLKEGILVGLKECVPVGCGSAAPKDNARVPNASLVYKDEAKYTCEEGYSTTGKCGADSKTEFLMSCDGTGEIVYVNDKEKGCTANLAGSLGDLKMPHVNFDANLKLYYPQTQRLSCAKGYSTDPTNVNASEFVVKTTTDCGFAKGIPTCTEIFCEEPPKIAHATFVGNSIFGQEVMYTCDTGYSLDGVAITQSVQKVVSTSVCEDVTIESLKGKNFKVTQLSKLHGQDTYTYDIIVGSKITQAWPGTTLVVGRSMKIGEKEEIFEHGAATWCPGGIERSARVEYTFGNELKLLEADEPSVCSYVYKVQIPEEVCKDVTHKKREVVKATFNVSCQATGKLSTPQGCFPVQCGTPRPVQNAKAENKSKVLTFDDSKMKYTCNEGFTLDAQVDSTADFTITCQADGNQVGFKTCLPVKCKAPENRSYSYVELPDADTVYNDTVKFVCMKGYSLDGKVPSGDSSNTEYMESCQANGKITETNKCKDIDWCVTGEDYCGSGGKCIDELYGYKCSCLAGYEVDEGHLVDGEDAPRAYCVEINECEDPRWKGNKLCKAVGNGTCIDKLNKYTCDCPEGYEAYDLKGEPKGRQMCKGVSCGMAPAVANSMPLFKRKVVFPNNVGFTCDVGFTTTADVQGPRTFERSCQSDKKLTKNQECKPVVCPTALPVVPFSTIDGKGPLSYLQDNATYTCDKGYTTTGYAEGKSSFVVKCNEMGKYVGMSVCKKVTCGDAPPVTNAQFSQGEKFYSDIVGYKCFPGYSTDGKVSGSKAFDVTCEETGNFTEALTCNRISCGEPKKYEFAQQETQEMFYKDHLEISCEKGYSVTGWANGAAEFVMKCEADGNIAPAGKYEGCKPVSCGKPKPNKGSVPESPDTPVFYGESRKWNCKPKYSVDGLPSGNTSFELSCEASGKFSETSPSDCTDINFCQPGNPCGMNGDCFDCTSDPDNCKGPPPKFGYKSPGVKIIKTKPTKYGKHVTRWEPSPYQQKTSMYGIMKSRKGRYGRNKAPPPKNPKKMFLQTGGPPFKANEDYACSCKKGYETTEEPGFLTCTEDDCHGRPCGNGGQCIDLSGKGIEGAYDCQCKKGYQKVKNELGKATCAPYKCADAPPTVENSQTSRLNVLKPPTWTGRKGDEVIAWDSLFYTCDVGYSQDGSQCPSAKTFTAHCNENGVLLGMKMCRPAKCDNIQLQMVPDSFSVIAPEKMENFYTYKQKVEFTCMQGFTLGDPFKRVRGQPLRFEDPLPTLPDETFSIICQANGKFTEAQECKRRSCGKPGWIRNGMPSKATLQFFDDKVIYSCKTGYETFDGKSSYMVRCNPNGLFTKLYNCYPVKCYRKDGSYLVYGKSMRKDCPPGMKTELDLEYTMETCQADKSIRVHGTCKMQKFKVNGFVTDASNKDFVLGGAQLTLTKQAVSTKSCKDLGWVDFEFKGYTIGAQGVCGSSDANGCTGRAASRSNHADAEQYCESQGARLCTEYEMQKGESCGSGSGCSGYDDDFVWTSTPCSTTAGGMKVFKCATSMSQCKKASTSAGVLGRCCADTVGGGTGTSTKVFVTAGQYSGKYETLLAKGTWHCKASYPDYIDATQSLAVNTNLMSFKGIPGAGDIALTQKMAPGEWRIVIGWGEETWDMDSWTMWGEGLWTDGSEVQAPCECGWYNQHEFCQWDTSGVSAVLERDETQGFGPETTYLKGVGDCVKTPWQNCILTFSVVNYTPESKSLQASSLDDRAVMTVYRGSEVVEEIKMSELMSSMGQDQTQKVMFTIDTSSNDKYWKGWPFNNEL